MAAIPATPVRSARPRNRPSQPRTASSRIARSKSINGAASEPPRLKTRYIPGGPGGGGRYVYEDGTEVPVGGTGPGGYNYIGDRGRIGRQNKEAGIVPPVYHRRDRRDRPARLRAKPSTAARAPMPARRFTSAAQAAAVVQSDGYKPREERSLEEFHPDLDVDFTFMTYTTDEVDGVSTTPRPITPSTFGASTQSPGNGAQTPKGIGASANGDSTPTGSIDLSHISAFLPGTPGFKKRPGRPPKDPVKFYAAKFAAEGKMGAAAYQSLALLQNTPKTVPPPLQNQTAKERLTLPQPSYRRTDSLARFEDGYIDKSMSNVGYQESDIYIRPESHLIRLMDNAIQEDLDLGSDGETSSGGISRVEYDMDEQDKHWLEEYNAERKLAGYEEITLALFEITITKIETEWHALEKRIPKPNPKPPQTHRPRSSSAAAVNGEPQAGEEQDSKCAICDDGDCENTNAIVFCDGCDLAVHQECYGVPFIPEGQWLCRKCQLIGRGIPTCIFCPNTDGAFKQTNASKWSHLLCAMWIPEVSLGNHTFMEPVMEVEKVPKTRWKLTCYLCNQKMGACIQCGNKACYQAFHVTCARRARLFLKMKNTHGTLSVLDGKTVLKAFCDKHCPADYSAENDVARAARDAQIHYKRAMKGRIWADSQASALAIAESHRHTAPENPAEELHAGPRLSLTMGDSKKKDNTPQKPMWKMPSGAPIIPSHVFEIVANSLQRFTIRKRREFVNDMCKYWTLKREARRGAPLLKRLQAQNETFSSTEMTRRNFPGMGSAGLPRLERRLAFAENLLADMERLKLLAAQTLQREAIKLEAAELEEHAVDLMYFPIHKLAKPIIEKAISVETKTFFTDGLELIKKGVDSRFYASAIIFAKDLCYVLRKGIEAAPAIQSAPVKEEVIRDLDSLAKQDKLDIKERQKFARKIIKAIRPQLEAAVAAEAELSNQVPQVLGEELLTLLESSTNVVTSAGDIAINGVHNSTNGSADKIYEATGIDGAANEVRVTDGTNGSCLTRRTSMTKDAADTQVKSSTGNGGTPPHTNGCVSAPSSMQPSPPTPPISNGSVNGSVPTNSNNLPSTNVTQGSLGAGGVSWYLAPFSPEGATISEDHLNAREVVRSMSEELSEMDDEELKRIGADAMDLDMNLGFGGDGAGDDVSADATAVPVQGSGNVVGTTPKTAKKPKKKRAWRGFK